MLILLLLHESIKSLLWPLWLTKFPLASLVFIQDPSKFAVAVAVSAADSGSAPEAAADVEEKKEEPAEESDDDMGFSLFD